MKRYLLVNDASGKWFIRHVRMVEYNLTKDEKIYRCDAPAGGPYDTLDFAIEKLRELTA
jgi:hypothetical protein